MRFSSGVVRFGDWRRASASMPSIALACDPGLVDAAVDHHLRRVDVALLQGAGVDALPLGGLLAGEAVLPADVVPVVDVEGQRDDVGPPRQLAELRSAGGQELQPCEVKSSIAQGPPCRLGRGAAAGQQARAGDQEGTSSDDVTWREHGERRRLSSNQQTVRLALRNIITHSDVARLRLARHGPARHERLDPHRGGARRGGRAVALRLVGAVRRAP